MIHTDEDDEFDRIARENAMKGQPYHFKEREWVGLTDQEIDDLSRTMVKGNKSVNWLCQAIEAKLKEKNEKT
jgi:hypothetical protein